MNAKSTELAPWDEPTNATGLAAIEATPALLVEAYDAIKFDKVPPEIGDPEITARLILERIQAGTFDESLEPSAQVPAWAELYPSTPVAVMGFHMNKSTIENRNGQKGVYCIVELADTDTGEFVTVHTGGKNVLMQLVKAWEERRYPFVAQLEVNETGSGNTTYWLRRPESK